MARHLLEAQEFNETNRLTACECSALPRVWTNDGPLGQSCVRCENCGAQTPWYWTPAEARACWRRMMEVEK
jgi:hypothetical protein